METVFYGLNNAYILFSFIVGLYAAYLAAQNIPISGNFWGTMWTNTGLAAAILSVGFILTLQGKRPYGFMPGEEKDVFRWVYYLYGVYFIISLPGLFTLLGGNDNRRAAFFFSCVALFNALAAYRVGHVLVTTWK